VPGPPTASSTSLDNAILGYPPSPPPQLRSSVSDMPPANDLRPRNTDVSALSLERGSDKATADKAASAHPHPPSSCSPQHPTSLTSISGTYVDSTDLRIKEGLNVETQQRTISTEAQKTRSNEDETKTEFRTHLHDLEVKSHKRHYHSDLKRARERAKVRIDKAGKILLGEIQAASKEKDEIVRSAEIRRNKAIATLALQFEEDVRRAQENLDSRRAHLEERAQSYRDQVEKDLGTSIAALRKTRDSNIRREAERFVGDKKQAEARESIESGEAEVRKKRHREVADSDPDDQEGGASRKRLSNVVSGGEERGLCNF
jgi:hypothetical protein